jgi:hypothetical protein
MAAKVDALIVALAKRKAGETLKGKKPDGYKAVAKDLIAAMKDGDEDRVAKVLKALSDIGGEE